MQKAVRGAGAPRPHPRGVWYDVCLEGFGKQGTFTPEGTWQAAAPELPELARLGITVVEVMPVADFPGTFGWGYDGVNLFAPTRLYGTPDDFRRFVDRAHAAGLGVILDVVYNYVGPDGNYLKPFSAAVVPIAGSHFPRTAAPSYLGISSPGRSGSTGALRSGIGPKTRSW